MKKYVYLLIHEDGMDIPTYEVFYSRKKAKMKFLKLVLKWENCKNITELEAAIKENTLKDAYLKPYSSSQEMLKRLFYTNGDDIYVQVQKKAVRC